MVVGSAVAAGYGRVQGRMVAAYAQDFFVLGGTLGKVEGDKIADLIDWGSSDAYSIVGTSGFGWCLHPGYGAKPPGAVRPAQEDVRGLVWSLDFDHSNRAPVVPCISLPSPTSS